MLMYCADLIWLLSVHQSEHYFGASFLLFLLLRQRTGVFCVTLNKILLNYAHIGSATHMPHVHIFTVISRLTPHHPVQYGSVCAQVCFRLNMQYSVNFTVVSPHPLTRQWPYHCLTDRAIFSIRFLIRSASDHTTISQTGVFSPFFFKHIFNPKRQWPYHSLTDQVKKLVC